MATIYDKINTALKTYTEKLVDKLKNSCKKYWLLAVLIGLELWIAKHIVVFFVNTFAIDLLWLLTVYTLWIVTFYTFFKVEGSSWLDKHQTFLVVLAIILPILLFFLHDSIQTTNSFKKYEVSLKEENNRNNSHLQSIKNDLLNDPSTIFWRDFSLDSYRQYWDYIHLNYSQGCKDLYATLTINLGILNNMNQMKRELVLIPNKLLPLNLPREMIKTASSTQPILNDIIGKCQYF